MEAGVSQQRLKWSRFPEAVPVIGDGAQMALRDAAQFAKERDFVVRAPHGDRQPATLRQRATHLRRRRGSVRKELQPLLADDHVERLTVTQRQLAGIALAPVNGWFYSPRHGKHVRADVDADDISGFTEPLSCNARHYSCSTGDIE